VAQDDIETTRTVVTEETPEKGRGDFPSGIDDRTSFDFSGEDDLAEIAADPNRLRLIPDDAAGLIEQYLPRGSDTFDGENDYGAGELPEGTEIDADLAHLPKGVQTLVMRERQAGRAQVEQHASQFIEERRARVAADKRSIEASEASLKRDRETAMAALTAANEEGDAKKITEAQAALIKVDGTERELTRHKGAVTAEEERLKTVQPGAAQPGDAATGFKSRNASWFGKNADATAFARGLEQELQAKGITPEDPRYFREIEGRTARAFPQIRPGGRAAADGLPPRRQGMVRSPVAPVGRQPAATTRGPASRVVLGPSDRALMKTWGVNPDDAKAQAMWASQMRSIDAKGNA
jgi:hypothetical protein